MLTNAAGERDRIQSVQCRGKRANVFTSAVSENLQRQFRILVSLLGRLFQVAYVSAQP